MQPSYDMRELLFYVISHGPLHAFLYAMAMVYVIRPEQLCSIKYPSFSIITILSHTNDIVIEKIDCIMIIVRVFFETVRFLLSYGLG